MGLGASRLLTRHEEEFENGERIINPKAFDKYDLFIDWNLEDIQYARTRLEKKAFSLSESSAGNGDGEIGNETDEGVNDEGHPSSLMPLAQVLTRWEDFYVISYEVKERHHQALGEAGMKMWHPACNGFAMRKDDEAEELYAEYQLEDVFRPKKGNDRHDHHTDDERSDVEEEQGDEEGKDMEGEDAEGMITNKEGFVAERESLAASDITNIIAMMQQPIPSVDTNPNEPPLDPSTTTVVIEDDGAPVAAAKDGILPSPAAAEKEKAVDAHATDSSLPTAEESLDPDAPMKPPSRPPSPDVELIKRPLPEAFDPAKRSPIFFGYHSTTLQGQIQERAAAVNKGEAAELEALARLRKKRSEKVDILLQEASAKRAIREKRIEDVMEAQKKRSDDRERESRKVEKMLGGEEYRAWLLTFQTHGQGILAANQAELDKMRKASQAKSTEDEIAINELQSQLKAYDDLMSLVRPQGPLLVETAKRELMATSDALTNRMQTMKDVQHDLTTLNEEMDNADMSLASQTRSLRLSIEARLNEERRKVEAVLQEMNDTEVLLHGAMARKAKEEKILPLFDCLKHSSETEDYLPLQELLVGLTLMCKDEPFSEKLRYLLTLFDYNRNHFLGSQELIELLDVVFRFLGYSAFMRVHVSREEVENLVIRAFLLEKIDPVQGMTLHEAKKWLRSLVSRSHAIAGILNCTWADAELSTYQRQSMDGIHQLEKGILTITDLKYHAAKSLLTFRPLLASDSKMMMHSRALARGADDPLKPNYSRFISKKSNRALAKVVPLRHGHLGSLLDWRRKNMSRAATMLQSIFRGIKGRRYAEMKAKVQAFERAKETALQRMRDKVRQEVLMKENLTGMEKLKYDAKIRNRAAKMRAAGLQAERDDVLAAIIKEGVDAGEREVRLRFREIAREKGLDKYMDAEEGADDLKAVTAAMKENQVDLTVAIAAATSEKTATLMSPRDAATAGGGGKVGVDSLEVMDKGREGLDSVINLSEGKEGLREETLHQRRQALIRGCSPMDLFRTGENIAEQLLRFQLILPDLSRDDLYQRLRSLEGVLTELKVQEMMLELPSKRLLMAYVDQMGKYDLPSDLQHHFRIVRGFAIVSDILRDVMRSDLDYGLIASAARLFYQAEHEVVESHWQARVQRGLKRATEIMSKAGRSAALIALSPEDQVRAMMEKELVHIRKKQDILAQNESNLAKVTKKIGSTRLALEQLGRRLRNLDRYLIVKVKKDDSVLVEDMPVEQRVDWYARYSAALKWPEDSKEALRAKYTELSNVVHDFTHMSERLAVIIINELYLPVDRKTIKPIEGRVCDGRAKEGGRGVGGMGLRYKYEAWNIRLKVFIDDHGIFNGSDECAAKAGGAERRNSLEAHKLYTQGLGIPLITTVDYHGFRILAVSKMPTQIVKYSDTGDVRSRKEHFCFGTQDRGDTFVDSEKRFDTLLESMSKRLNLSKHAIKAFKDINSKYIWGSADLRGFKGEDGMYHILNFWRLFPCEYPGLADHLIASPRDMSMFSRFLRPEFVRKWPEPLSADANLIIIGQTNDCDKQMNGVREATIILIQKTIMDFAEYLCKQGVLQVPAWQGYGLDLMPSLHRYGINIRHLGRLRSLFWRPLGNKVNVIFNSRRLITHGDLRLEVQRGNQVRIHGEIYRISTDPKDDFSDRTITLTEKVRLLSENHVEIWTGEVSDDSNSSQLRLLILAEMVARTTKNLLRSYLRMILKIMKTSTEYMQVSLITDFLNICTGSHPLASMYWSEQLYHSIVVRFGPTSVSVIERPNLRYTLSPIIIYIIERLQHMVGFSIARDCLADFHQHPQSYRFTTEDVITPIKRVKHNVPILAFADAMLLNLQADAITSRTYSDHVLEDSPLLYWKFGERRGSKLAYNYGSLGTDVSGSYSPAIIFEVAGPIKNEEVNRAIRLHAAEKAKIDSVYNPRLAPTSYDQRFSVEIWARVMGGWDTHLVLLMNSRYCLAATRENRWAFQVFAKYVQVTLLGPEISREAWSHLVLTYDGALVRMYLDARYVTGMELSAEVEKQLDELKASRQETYDKLELEERKAKELCWQETERECARYFKGKDGRALLKKHAMKLIEQAEFQSRLGLHEAGSGGDAAGAAAAGGDGRGDGGAAAGGVGGPRSLPVASSASKHLLTTEEATAQAMAAYRNETYAKNVRSINERFKVLGEELMVNHQKQDFDAQVKLTTSLRVGSTGPNRSTNTGSSFFEGELCHFAIYDKDLSHDRVQAHYLSGKRERSIESERFYYLASQKFNEAMRFVPDDPVALAKYAESVCNYVHTDGARQVNEKRTKNKIAQAMKSFVGLENYDGMAELLRRLPNEYGFSDTACMIFQTILTGRPDYFTGSYFNYKDLALVPNRFLLYESEEVSQVKIAALMYQTIMQDKSLALFYGNDDLTFIRQIKNPKVVLALVKQVQLGQDKRVLDLNTFRDCTDIVDEDMHIVADYRRGALGMTLRNCKDLSDRSFKAIARYCPGLNAFTIDGCVQASNESLSAVGKYCKELQLLSLERCIRITDSALASLVENCPQLKILNLNQCSQLSDEGILHVARACKGLELLHLSHCFVLTDPGMFNFTTEVNHSTLMSLDISACRGLSDDGYEVVGRALTSLTYLNLSSARVTDIGMRAITHNLWKLKSLIMRDCYVVSDEVFQFDAVGDGRREAEEKMLTSLTELDVTDCSRLGNGALACISCRCPDLVVFKMSGCSNMTDGGVASLLKDPKTGQQRGQHLMQVHMAYCIQLTNAAVQQLCEACPRLDVLDVSGCVHLTDEMIQAIARYCPHLQTLGLSRCKRLTDRALCTLADYLWIEDLDISYCNKITDEGIEVIAIELQGIKRLNLAWLQRLTELSLRALARNCVNSLKVLNLTECTGISSEAVEELKADMPHLSVIVKGKQGDGGGLKEGGEARQK